MKIYPLLLVLLTGCTSTSPDPCNATDIEVPEGFCVRIFAKDIGPARHLVVLPNGDVYVAVDGRNGGIKALRDTTGDGLADEIVRATTDVGGAGIALRGDEIFFSSPTTVFRYRIKSFGVLEGPDTVVKQIPGGGHASRSLALGDSNALFVNVGSVSNVCGGDDPCAELSTRAGIWKFDANGTHQTQKTGTRYVTGIRNAVGMAWHPEFKSLFATQHGRDELKRFDQYYSVQDNDQLPSEEFMRVVEGDDFGWPYCYHDWRLNRKVLSPEYGGDGAKQGRCAKVANPLMGFPGHWAPNGLIFYYGKSFPPKYQGGAFIAFHGSWNRRHHDGYKVAFVPFHGSMPAGDYEIFADGFAGWPKNPGSADHRPVGLAVAPDGSLYVTDDQAGYIFNIYRSGVRRL